MNKTQKIYEYNLKISTIKNMYIQCPILLNDSEIISRTGIISYPLNSKVTGFETYHILALKNGALDNAQIMYPVLKEKIIDLLPSKNLFSLFSNKRLPFDFVFITKKNIPFRSGTTAKWTDQNTKIEHNDIGISYEFQFKISNPLLMLKSFDYSRKALFYKDDIYKLFDNFVQLKISSEITKQLNIKGVEETLSTIILICETILLDLNNSYFASKGLTIFDLNIKIEMDPSYQESKHNIQLVKYANKSLKNPKTYSSKNLNKLTKDDQE